MLHEDIDWRAMTAFDLGDVSSIAAKVHPGLYEAQEVLAERQRLYPNGAYVLEIGPRTAGYVLSHPWRSGTLPALNEPLGEIPSDADTYYIHDLALLPMVRRIGAARDMVGALEKHARAKGFATTTLVAVNGSQGFWEKQGFKAVPGADLLPDVAAHLRGYGPGASFMVKQLDAGKG